MPNSQKTGEAGTISNSFFMRPALPWYQSTKKDTTTKENYRPISLINTDAKILNEILPNWIQQYIKRITYHDQVGYVHMIQGQFNI